MTRLTVTSIVNPQKFLIFVFSKNVCTFITLFFVLYYLCIKLQKNNNSLCLCEGVSNAASMGGVVHLT